ncbi:MAG: cobalt ECF transporter T component CbiQ [Proteobacteria bacterium]|nr:cobalt ECF transporter T component CbiQ [Pseudomonadota bacterium]
MMFDDTWLNTSSFMYTFDPRLKWVVVFSFSLVAAGARTLSCLACAGVLVLFITCCANQSVLETLKRLVPVNGMVLFLWLFLPFTLQGKGAFALGPLLASGEGIHLALLITVKANLLMLMFLAFTSSTPIITAGQALSRLGLSNKLVHLFFFTYRYIHLIHQEYQRLKTAMHIRGFVQKTSVHTYKSYACLVGMVLVRSSNRAESVYRAMLCRGFHGKLYGSGDFFITKKDLFIFLIISAWIMGMGIIECTATPF